MRLAFAMSRVLPTQLKYPPCAGGAHRERWRGAIDKLIAAELRGLAQLTADMRVWFCSASCASEADYSYPERDRVRGGAPPRCQCGAPRTKGAYSTIEGGVLHTWGAFPTFTMPTNGTDNTPINVPLVLGDGTVITSREFGGVNGTGALYRLSHAGVVELASFDPIPLSAVPRFSNARGGIANGRIVEGTDGLLYGTTTYGGAYGAGSIWCAARDGSWIRVLHSFAVGGPSYPYGGLMQASDGKLYGTTFVNGVIFSFDPRLVATCQN